MFRKMMMLLGVLIAMPLLADDQTLYEMVRKDYQSQKISVIGELMQLSPEDAEKFWPLYREYEHEVEKLNDLKFAIIRDYGKNYMTMDNPSARDLIMRSFSVEERRIRVDKKYFRKMESALSALQAAKFFQANNQIELVVEMQIANSLPLISDPMQLKPQNQNQPQE